MPEPRPDPADLAAAARRLSRELVGRDWATVQPRAPILLDDCADAIEWLLRRDRLARGPGESRNTE